MKPSLEEPQADLQTVASRQNRLIIVLADISGYTDLMVANQNAALHGQIIVSTLIESILKEVDIPLILQEIEGDAIFLYAEHPGAETQWQEVLSVVGRKLPRFFEAFAEATIAAAEATMCRCAVCETKELRLKIVVHSGEAVFHSIRGRAQVSGVDIIQAHRLLKNSIPSNEYLLLTEAAHKHLGPSLNLKFTGAEETYQGLGSIRTFVHFPGDQESVRRKFYSQSATKLALEGARFAIEMPFKESKALFHHLRVPIAPFSSSRRITYATLRVLAAPLVFLALITMAPIRLVRRRARQN